MLSIWKIRGDLLQYSIPLIHLGKAILSIMQKIDSSEMIEMSFLKAFNFIIDYYRKATKRKFNVNLLYLTRELNIPDFVVETRHQVAHGHHRNLNLVTKSTLFLFHWIRENLFVKHKFRIEQSAIFNSNFEIYLQGQSIMETELTTADLNACLNKLFDVIIDSIIERRNKFELANKEVLLRLLNMLFKQHSLLPFLFFTKYFTLAIKRILSVGLSAADIKVHWSRLCQLFDLVTNRIDASAVEGYKAVFLRLFRAVVLLSKSADVSAVKETVKGIMLKIGFSKVDLEYEDNVERINRIISSKNQEGALIFNQIESPKKEEEDIDFDALFKARNRNN